MAHCDAKRSVPRTKTVQPQEPRAVSPPLQSFRDRNDEQFVRMRQRAEFAEERCKKQHKLILFASGALMLLRDIFLELRQSRYLTGLDEPKPFRKTSVVEASTVVERIVRHFSDAIPQLGNLSEVIAAVGEEAAKVQRSESSGSMMELPPWDGTLRGLRIPR